jgi:hypothetical protein
MPSKIVGLGLILRALTSFVLANRSTPEDWKRAKANQELILERARDMQTSLAERLAPGLEQVPLRAKRWQNAAEDWTALCDSELSDDAISSWCRAAVSGCS